jgi:hypothetical protein
VAQGFAGFPQGAAPMGAPGEANANVTEDFSYSGPCDGGGTVALAGKVSVSDAGTIGFDYTVTPNGCKLTTQGGKTFTLTGDPNLKASGDFSVSETGLDGNIDFDGRFLWVESEREGVCGVNLKVTYDFTVGNLGTTGSASMSGGVCGVSITRNITVEG